MSERDLHGPFVNLAILCRSVQHESDGAPSFIGHIQKIVIRQVRGRSATDWRVPFHCYVVVGLQSGFAEGVFPVSVEMISPNGRVDEVWRTDVAFRGQEVGETLIQRLDLAIVGTGLFWFDVLLGGRLLTRIPLRVEFVPREAT